jgi:myosin heavy subunit
MKANEKEDKKMANACFEVIGLDADRYRVGHTKVFFRAGTLGFLEELRDDKVGKIMTWLQAAVRTFLQKKEFKRLQEQRIALQVVQRNLRTYTQMKKWVWFDVMQVGWC